MALKEKYDFSATESNRYQYWLKQGFFEATEDKSKPFFSLVIPPPNVTSKLHLGHTYENTLQDLVIRRKRMQGYNTLYLPGTDHAGIATQAKVDSLLKSEGTNRYLIGREEFLKRAWQWTENYQGQIFKQWETVGISVDYSKLRFTLDKGLSQAVYLVFKTLYEENLIYRDYKIINWDPVAKTALSNIEVIYKEQHSKLYYIFYPLVDGTGQLEIATTRPETMFADQALMVNPKDKRYQKYIGQEVYIPLTKTKIKVIADEYVDVSFGTGVVKVTPAHDPNDFVVGKKHHLKQPLCMNDDATMNEMAGKYNGLDRFVCREQLINDLQANNFLSKIEDYDNSIGFSERTDAMVEPRLSLQWFVKMKDLAKDALKTKVAFHPQRFKTNFKRWMENVDDWCISRQLWWGHQIPVWYENNTGKMVVSDTCPGKNYKQDEDVLDTWFSSGLWPFTTLNWPDKENHLFQNFYQTSLMVTGYDIIFFWVARMIFLGRHFTGLDPFKDCLIHGLVRDVNGIKMSKSFGNGVDPIDVRNKYGIDSLRHFLVSFSSPGLDLRYDETKVRSSWSFLNKLWNAVRFIELKIPHIKQVSSLPNPKTDIDYYILNKLNELIKKVDHLYDKYLFQEASKEISNFLWDEFSSGYLEIAKLLLSKQDYVDSTATILKHVIICVIKLLHPIAPFITDELYEAVTGEKNLMVSCWPGVTMVKGVIKNFSNINQLITIIRNTKAENNLLNKQKINLKFFTVDKKLAQMLQNNLFWLQDFVGLSTCSLSETEEFNQETEFMITCPTFSLIFNKDDFKTNVDETAILLKRKAVLESEIKRSNGILNNPNFKAKAPQSKIEEEEKKFKLYTEELCQILTKLDK